MKTTKIKYLWAVALTLNIVVHGCSKDATNGPGSTTGITTTDLAAAQDAESQDAVVTQVNQDLDNSMDVMEANNFNSTATKAGSDCATVTISPKDTIVFPKTITINYNCVDTVNGELMSQTGQLVIVVDTIPVGKKMPWRSHLKRSVTFNNFMVTTDSSSFTINGTRTLFRMASKTKSMDNLNKRAEVKDSIASVLNFVVKNGATSFNVTWNSNRTRDAVRYYNRLTATGWWHPEIEKDTITFTGKVWGVNGKGDDYSRVINTPLVYTRCPFWPHNIVIPSGEITYTSGSNVMTVGYAADGCKTIITITKNGKTKTIDRRIGRKFYRWWKV